MGFHRNRDDSSGNSDYIDRECVCVCIIVESWIWECALLEMSLFVGIEYTVSVCKFQIQIAFFVRVS